jgi:hypothetical protein
LIRQAETNSILLSYSWLWQIFLKIGRTMMFKKFLVVALVLAFSLTVNPALADEPSGTISVNLTSASALVGASWGQGVLTFGDRTYAFKVKGLKVMAVGLKKASVNGEVYNLKNASDLAGTYKKASQGGLTLIKGKKGAVVVENDKGVLINVFGRAKGMDVGLVKGGLTVKDVK